MKDISSGCLVMGIVNVTPDSFSDGGKFFTPEEAVRRARNLMEEGAAIVDLGGESTRPDATPIGWEEEWRRIGPVLAELVANPSERQADGRVLLSVDTYHPETAERALEAGAKMINCVYPESVPEMLRLAAARSDVELVVPASARDAVRAAHAELLPRIYFDPMIGFGTTREEDLRLLRSIPDLARGGRVMVGASRKRIVKRLTGGKTRGKDLAGNLTIAVWAALRGASAVRVHDVGETVQALKVLSALTGDGAF